MNVAICLFGHLRTFYKTASSINALADINNADIYIATWDQTDVSDSWHGLNSRRRETAVVLQEVRSSYPRLKSVVVKSQDQAQNMRKYVDAEGRGSFVGHQLHMWSSVHAAIETSLSDADYDYLFVTRPDILFTKSFSICDQLVEPNTYNFGWRPQNGKKYPYTCFDIGFVVQPSFLPVVRDLVSEIHSRPDILQDEFYALEFFSKRYGISPFPDGGPAFEIIRDPWSVWARMRLSLKRAIVRI